VTVDCEDLEDWEKDLAKMGFDESEREAISSTIVAMNGNKCRYKGLVADIGSHDGMAFRPMSSEVLWYWRFVKDGQTFAMDGHSSKALAKRDFRLFVDSEGL